MNKEKIMNREYVKDKVFSLIQGVLEGSDINIREDSGLMDDLDLSSLEIMTMISDIEDEFNIVLTEAEMRKVISVSDLIEAIYSKSEK